MPVQIAKVQALTIPINTAVSNLLKAREVYDDALTVGLLGPAALDAHTFTIEVTDDPDVASPVFRTLRIGTPAADAAPPGAAQASVFPEIPTFAGFRIKDTSGNVAAERVWKITKSWYSGQR